MSLTFSKAIQIVAAAAAAAAAANNRCLKWHLTTLKHLISLWRQGHSVASHH
jgi:hypothetical protein